MEHYLSRSSTIWPNQEINLIWLRWEISWHNLTKLKLVRSRLIWRWPRILLSGLFRKLSKRSRMWLSEKIQPRTLKLLRKLKNHLIIPTKLANSPRNMTFNPLINWTIRYQSWFSPRKPKEIMIPPNLIWINSQSPVTKKNCRPVWSSSIYAENSLTWMLWLVGPSLSTHLISKRNFIKQPLRVTSTCWSRWSLASLSEASIPTSRTSLLRETSSQQKDCIQTWVSE